MSIITGNVGNTNTDVYTSSGNTAVTFASFTSSHGSAVALDIHVVPNGDSAGNVNLIANSIDMTASETYQIYSGAEKLLLENGDKITAVANVDAVIHSVISYTSV